MLLHNVPQEPFWSPNSETALPRFCQHTGPHGRGETGILREVTSVNRRGEGRSVTMDQAMGWLSTHLKTVEGRGDVTGSVELYR
jgi:hypothetical protein